MGGMWRVTWGYVEGTWVVRGGDIGGVEGTWWVCGGCKMVASGEI